MISTFSLFVFLLLIYIIFFIFWTWTLIDCLKEETDNGNIRLIWSVVIVITYIFGALLYCVIRRPQRILELGV
jgi:hypothetical protein